MALTLFLFNVSKLEVEKAKPEVVVTGGGDDQSISSEVLVTPLISDENTTLLSAKIIFRGINLWSNNVPVHNGTANFVARGRKPTKLNFNLATMLMPDDKVRIEFYTMTVKKKRNKKIAIFDLMLESLIDAKYIDLPEENLSDPNSYLMSATVQLKLYYTPPDIEQQNAALRIAGENELVDWRNMFDDEGKHGGHPSQHVTSKSDSRLKRFRTNIFKRTGDADADSFSDSEFDGNELGHTTATPLDKAEKHKVDYNNLELLEKSLGRYEGNEYEMTEWQIMVHIIQGKDLHGIDINPYVGVQIDDQQRYTKVHKFSNSPYFGEFFTFDFKLPASRMMKKVILFKVHHARKIISEFTHTKPIGLFQVDVSTVFNEKDHAFERKWAQLINPDAIDAPCGHLLLSIAITERGSVPKDVFGELEQDDDEFKPSNTLIPAAMPRRLFPVQLKIIFYTATELPEMMTDFLASVSKKILKKEWEPVDPYVEVTYNSMQAATDHRNGTKPVWAEGFYFIGRFPPLVRTIKIALKDHAAVQQDRVISSFFIDLFLISESNPAAGFFPTLGPTWMFLYGSPREYTINTDHDGLSQGMGEAVCYKGRLLMAIECHAVSGDSTSIMNIQKESGIPFPEAHVFPMKRNFILFGCIYDVAMIDKSFGNSTISFELSIGPNGYLNPHQLAAAVHNPVSSLTRPYPCISVNNNKQHYRLPIDLQKPVMFTNYTFHDYMYRMTLSNRLKHASEHMYKLIRDFEFKVNSKVTNELLTSEYQKIEEYIQTLPCGCGEKSADGENHGATGIIHPTLYEILNAGMANLKMNVLDTKRRKKILHNLESLKSWISKEIDYDEDKRFEIVKELNKMARALRQMATDVQPSLPDIFLWMISDSKRVAYTRIQPEDLLFNLCEGEKGLQSGRVQTIFLKTPRTTDKPLKSSTNAKVQIFLWLGVEEYEQHIFKQLPAGFDMPTLPLPPTVKYMQYYGRTFYELRCHCCKARSLMASDETGLSDPYLSITVGNQTQTTPILIESLCPQWNITLAFEKLMHVGTRETAEEIIGNIVVECYDYDDSSDGPDLIGRFSATAKLSVVDENNPNNDPPFKWFEFKIGEKRAGELLAVFELIEVDRETQIAESAIRLEEIEKTKENFPGDSYIIKLVENKLYHIPRSIMPPLKTYEIEIMFWGLRECRSINLQSIQQAEVSIECAGERIKRKIEDVQKYPNFQSKPGEPDNYKLRVDLPDDNNFWPYLSILCVQNRLFGLKEIVGNLVVTDLQKYLEKPISPLSANDEAIAIELNELSKVIPHDFNRVRRSVIDAYEAALTAKDKKLGKEKLDKFESEAGQGKNTPESQISIINADALSEDREDEENDDDIGTSNKITDDVERAATEPESPNHDNENNGNRPLTALDKMKRTEMEKGAQWWTKYYASKAKKKLAQRAKPNMDEGLADSFEAYAGYFENESRVVIKPHMALWIKAKKVFLRAGKAQKKIRRFAAEHIIDSEKSKSAVDESLDNIENAHLKELTLLQTFDIVETELEHVNDYEGFNDCLDTFPLYKGKGSSRSDEMGDENRIYAKFKGKLRIQEIQPRTTNRMMSRPNINNIPRMSANPGIPADEFDSDNRPIGGGITQTSHQMLQFDMNKHAITLKCRLYIVKALLYRGSDRSGKADPFIKILVNNDTIIDDVKCKLQNTLEPVFGKAYEFDVKLPIQSIIRVQVWDWDMTSSNDMIAETKIDIENRWFSCHRATCGIPKRYDSSGYNAWRDTKKPDIILKELCLSSMLNPPAYTVDSRAVIIGDQRFDGDPECFEFVTSKKQAADLTHRKVFHESPEDYIRQNTALAALHGWGRKINPKAALVAEHIESRSLFHPETPETEQGKLEMWLDFFPMSRPPSSSPTDITPPKPAAYQLRLIVMNTSDVELDDENFITGEKTSDIYVKAWILGEGVDGQQTDIHYRSFTGDGNFNWRFVFNFDYLEIEEKIVHEAKDSVFQVGNTKKKIPPRIVIRVYDSDLISADDFLGECILNLTHLPVGAKVSKKCKAGIVLNPKHPALNLFMNKRIAGWWPMIAPPKEGEIRDVASLGGKVEAEFSLVTAEEAEANPVGKAREAPQPLPEPNRPQTSFLWFTSPWKTFRYIIWGNFKWTVILSILLVIFIIFLLLALWSVPGQVITQIGDKIFKNNG